ncbi:MAG: type VI secretion system contractile sheath large subunit [Rhodothermia bacterium]|nr:type VI secretion system contractile sheath large subunit [Rhodothermia bacterium]
MASESGNESGRKVGIGISSDPDATRISKPSESGADRRIELPFRLLLVSDLTPQGRVDGWDGPSRLRRVDRNTFADFLSASQVTLSLDVANKIHENPKLLEVNLVFPNLKAFDPLNVAEQVAPLNQLLRIRVLVNDVLAKRIDAASFQSGLAAEGIDESWAARLHGTLLKKPADRKPTDSADPVDRILGMVALDEAEARTDQKPSRPPDESPLGKLIRAISGEEENGVEIVQSAAEEVLADLDTVINRQLRVILEHPALRALESAWRGLKFLVDRINFRRGSVLDVLAASKYDLPAALHHQVLVPEHAASSAEPLSVIVLDFDFSQRPDDISLMEDAASTGESLQVPVLAGASPNLCGADSPASLARIPGLRQHQAGPEFIGWNAFREQSRSKSLALVLPPFVLRERFRASLEEGDAGFLEGEPLWGGPALVVGAALSSSLSVTGWPTRFLDSSLASLEEIELWKAPTGNIPLSAAISGDKQAELEEAGFVVLGCRLNSDSMYVARAPTAYKPNLSGEPEADSEARSHASLATQVFLSRIAQCLIALRNEIPSDTPTDAVISELDRRLSAFLAAKGEPPAQDCVSVEYVPEAGGEHSRVFAVRIRPPGSLVPHPLSLVLGFEVS